MSGFVGMGHNSPPKDYEPDRDCHCFTCGRDIHHLGIMSHRAKHRRNREDCKIMFSGGNTVTYHFSRSPK